MKDSFCYILWTNARIAPNGFVSNSCWCEESFEPLGNIHKTTLKEIFHSTAAFNLRSISLDDNLECFEKCFYSFVQEDDNKDYPSIRKKASIRHNYNSLETLIILFSYRCNITCKMCRTYTHHIELDYNVVKNNVDLSPFNQILISGGEPLFSQSAKKYFDYCVEQDKRPTFMTNGLLIDDRWSEKIALHSPEIYISLNAATKKTHEAINIGSSWDKVLKNIQKIRSHDTDISIVGHMTILPENLKEIAIFIDKYKEFGFDRVNFSYSKRVSSLFDRCPWMPKKLKETIKAKINKYNRDDVESARLRMLGLLD